jgi:hypothetical protein
MNRNRKRSLLAAAAAAGGVLLAAASVVGFAGESTAASQVVPSNQSPPTLSGDTEVGKTLTANAGRWTGTEPITFVYRYQRCDRNGANCFTGGSTTQRRYELTAEDLGKTIRVRVTATNSDGSTNATSAPTAVIRPGAPAPPATGCGGNAPIQVSRISQPDRLQLDQFVPNPPVVNRSTTSLTLRVHVSCKGKSVQGALVKVEAVPFNQFSSPAEQTTGADGFATVTMGQLSGFPAADRQQLLVLFLRARKAGEDVLGGISTRRLVSIPVNLNR